MTHLGKIGRCSSDSEYICGRIYSAVWMGETIYFRLIEGEQGLLLIERLQEGTDFLSPLALTELKEIGGGK